MCEAESSCTKLFVRTNKTLNHAIAKNISKRSCDLSTQCQRSDRLARGAPCADRSAIAKILVRDAFKVTWPALAPGNGHTTMIPKSIVHIPKARMYSRVSRSYLLVPSSVGGNLKMTHTAHHSHRISRPYKMLQPQTDRLHRKTSPRASI